MLLLWIMLAIRMHSSRYSYILYIGFFCVCHYIVINLLPPLHTICRLFNCPVTLVELCSVSLAMFCH